jgi:hypothetical protein
VGGIPPRFGWFHHEIKHDLGLHHNVDDPHFIGPPQTLLSVTRLGLGTQRHRHLPGAEARAPCRPREAAAAEGYSYQWLELHVRPPYALVCGWILPRAHVQLATRHLHHLICVCLCSGFLIIKTLKRRMSSHRQSSCTKILTCALPRNERLRRRTQIEN